MKPKDKLVQELIDDLENNPEDWQRGDYTLVNIKTGVEIWIANTPIFDLHIWRPSIVHFTLLQRFKICQAIKDFSAKIVLNAIKKEA